MTSRKSNRKFGVRFAAAMALGAVLGIGEGALAQAESQQPRIDNSRPQQGVRSKGPRIRRPQTSGDLPINRRNTLLPQRQRSPSPDRGVDRPGVQRPIRRAPDGDIVITRPDGVTIRRPGGGGVILQRPGGIVTDGSVVQFGPGGFRAGGVFTDDDNSVVFRAGSGLRTRQPHFGIPGHHRHHHHHDHCGSIGFPIGFFNWWDDDYDSPGLYYAGYADPFVTTAQTYAQQQAAQQAAAAAAQAAQPPQLTELEQAELALAVGDSDEAVQLFQAYVDTHEETPEVVRSLALALFEAGRIEEAVATMALAYEREPSLAARPVEPMELEGDDTEMLDRVRRAVRYAHKVKTGSAWLTVAVLMQAQERDRVAMTMAERAKDAGLAEPVYNEFRVALGG